MRTTRTQLLGVFLAAAALAVLSHPARAEAVLSIAATQAAKEKTASRHFVSLGEGNVKGSLALAAEKRWGHDYMHARYYSPVLARFLSVDPVLGNTTSSQSWNRYSYVLSNPVGLVDPNGEEAVTVVVATMAAGAALVAATATFLQAENLNDPSMTNGEVIAKTTIDAANAIVNTITSPATTDPIIVAPISGYNANAAPDLSQVVTGSLVAPPPINGTIETPISSNPVDSTILSESADALTRGGKRVLGNLTGLSGATVAEAIRSRGGGASQVNQVGSLAGLTVAEVANRAAQGDSAAKTAVKIIKQAKKKSEKSGGK